jgi:hypothetical protein
MLPEDHEPEKKCMRVLDGLEKMQYDACHRCAAHAVDFKIHP